MKIKLKWRHFDTTEVMETESQAVLNTLTRQDFQNAFYRGRSAASSTYARKETTWKVMVASRFKVRVWPVGSISPGNYGWLFVY
jgi:hypothetical protein